MKKSISKLNKIDSEDFNYSQIGEASAKQFLYLLEKKKDIDKLFQDQKTKKAPPQDFCHEKEKGVYDDIFEKDEYEDDIFDKEYEIKYQKELKEKKQKYEPPKNSCAYFKENTILQLQQKINQNKKKEESEEKEENEEHKDIRTQKKDMERQLKYELENERYKYHLIHHHHDLMFDKSLLNLNDQVSSSSYKPKLEYIFKKIIYSPEFNKMSGRYDQERKKILNENKKEIIFKKQKEKEYANYQKRLKKMRSTKLVQQKKHESSENELDEEQLLNKHKLMSDYVNLKKNYSNSMIFQRNSMGELGKGAGNLSKKFKKRNNSVLMKETKYSYTLDTNKDKKNTEEEYNENDYNNMGEDKKNVSNNLEDNTVSSVNRNKTTSGIKKISNFETEVLYPNISKNESNILVNKNYSYRKILKRKKGYNTLNILNNLRRNDNNSSNYPSKFQSINKKFRNNSSSASTKRRNKPSHKVVNFEKMLSRAYINKINEHVNKIYSTISPNYDFIRPKVIMKVVYAQKYYKKNRAKEFKSDFNQIVFDINKNYNNYNNHFPPKNVYLGKMTGRKIDKTLPSYMLDQHNRNAFNIFSDKSLKMNNFANGDLLDQKSSFNEKKTFNYKLKDQYSDNNRSDLEKELDSVFRKITKYPFGNKENRYSDLKSLSCSSGENQNNNFTNFMNQTVTKLKFPEYYKVNLDKYGKYPFSYEEKIDGFTMRTIKNSKSSLDLLTDNEKKIFLSKLDE